MLMFFIVSDVLFTGFTASLWCLCVSDLLGKSLQVLTSSSVLLQKLRQLQRTEALQRRGGGLQDEEEDDEEVEVTYLPR